MRKHTNSQIVEVHEDGSWTTTTVETEFPATKAQKAVAGGALVAICVVPFVPVLSLIAADWRENRRLKREANKAETSKND